MIKKDTLRHAWQKSAVVWKQVKPTVVHVSVIILDIMYWSVGMVFWMFAGFVALLAGMIKSAVSKV